MMFDGQTMADTLAPGAVDGESGQTCSDDRGSSAALADTIAEIRELYRRRRALHKAEKGLTLAIKAKERSAAVLRLRVAGVALPIGKFPKPNEDDAALVRALYPELYEARKAIEGCAIVKGQPKGQPLLKGRLGWEYRLERLAARLPVAKWYTSICGCNLLGLAIIVGEAGDLSDYATVSKLWKRLGLACSQDGERQRKVMGSAALEQKYSPETRAAIWTIGVAIVMAQRGENIGEYRRVYDARRAYEAAKNEVGDYAAQAERALKRGSYDKGTSAFKAYSAGRLPPKQLNARAKRYMEKRLLRDLWRSWRRDQAS